MRLFTPVLLCHREAASGTASCAKMSHRISCAEMDGAAILDRTVNRAFSRSRVVDGERRHSSRLPTAHRASRHPCVLPGARQSRCSQRNVLWR
jgi:hypothetical protein